MSPEELHLSDIKCRLEESYSLGKVVLSHPLRRPDVRHELNDKMKVTATDYMFIGPNFLDPL